MTVSDLSTSSRGLTLAVSGAVGEAVRTFAGPPLLSWPGVCLLRLLILPPPRKSENAEG